MKLDVKFYSQLTDKPAGIPDSWPGLVLEVGDDDASQPGFTRMSVSEYADYRALHQSEYDAWSNPIAAGEPARLAAFKDSKEPDLSTIRDQATQAAVDNAAFLAIASPSNAQVLVQVKALTQQNSKIIKALGRIIQRDLA